MYYVNMAQVTVSIKNFYGIRERCAIEGEVIERKSIIKKAKPSNMDEFKSKKDAQDFLEKNCNSIRELPENKGYRVSEFFIVDEKELLLDTQTEYKLITERAVYDAKEIRAMKKLLEYLGFYQRLSSLLAYERYGYLKKAKDTNGKQLIRYEDERQVLSISTDDFEIVKKSVD